MHKLLGIVFASISLTVLGQSASFGKTASEIRDLSEKLTVQINNPQALEGGSGFIVAREGDTYTVLTADHVVCISSVRSDSCVESIPFTIRTHSGNEYPLSIVRRFTQEGIDMTVVQFASTEEFPVATLGDATHMELGSTTYSVGFPVEDGKKGLQRDLDVREGYVIARAPVLPANGYAIRYASRTTVGMSGGPVFDHDGRVIGVHGWGRGAEANISDSISNESRGLKGAIPINEFLKWCSLTNDCPGLDTEDDRPSESPEKRLRNPKTARDFLIVGLEQHASNQIGPAISAYGESLRVNPSYADAFRHRGLAYVRQNRYDRAIQDWNRALAAGYVTADIYTDLGLAHSRLGNLKQAEDSYIEALRYDSTYFRAYRGLGDIYSEQEQFDLALENYSRALESYPRDGHSFFNRAVVYNNLGKQLYQQENLQSALELMEKALLDFKTASPLLLDSSGSSVSSEARINISQVQKNIGIIRRQIPSSRPSPGNVSRPPANIPSNPPSQTIPVPVQNHPGDDWAL